MKMKSKYICHVLLILFCLSVWPIDHAFSSDSINWYTYDEGMALEKTQKKKVFLHFYANWCRYCRKMAKETFQDPSVIAYLNANFTSIRVNTDKQTKIAASYGVRGLPTTWFLKENGERIGSLPGYIPPGKFLSILKKVYASPK
jgi:thioredoxin-related protein